MKVSSVLLLAALLTSCTTGPTTLRQGPPANIYEPQLDELCAKQPSTDVCPHAG